MPSLVNILGAGYSGTTMLDLMLGSNSRAVSCGEVYAWYRPFRSHHRTSICACSDPDCRIRRTLTASPEVKFHAHACESLKREFVVDSSKNLRWVADSIGWALDTGMRVFNIAIWKDPVSLCYSQWKRGESFWEWKSSFTRYYDRLDSLGISYVSVPQSTLVREPQVVLSRLCSLVGMSYEIGQERFWEHEHHHFFGSLGTRQQVKRGHSHFSETEEFPPEFMDVRLQIERDIERDSRLGGVLQRIADADACRPDAGVRAEQGERPRLAYLRHWYLWDSLRAAYRRLRPIRWTYAD